jgi:hypothetical protein
VYALQDATIDGVPETKGIDMADATIITYQRLYTNVSVASVGSSYASIATLSATKPSSGMVYDQQLNGMSPSLLRIMPYASSTSIGSATGVRVVGYTGEVNSADGLTYWLPTVLADFNLTFTSGTVPTYSLDSATQRPFAVIAQVAGTPAANLYSPGTAAASNVEVASAMVDIAGHQLVQVQFKAASGTPTMGVFVTTL